MVVALAVHDPLADADQVPWIRRIDVQIRFGEVLGAELRVGDVLGRVRTDVLSRGRSAVAQGGAAVGISLPGREASLVVDLRRVATDPLSGRDHAGDAALSVAGR